MIQEETMNLLFREIELFEQLIQSKPELMPRWRKIRIKLYDVSEEMFLRMSEELYLRSFESNENITDSIDEYFN